VTNKQRLLIDVVQKFHVRIMKIAADPIPHVVMNQQKDNDAQGNDANEKMLHTSPFALPYRRSGERLRSFFFQLRVVLAQRG
jgi:hypothetical protein